MHVNTQWKLYSQEFLSDGKAYLLIASRGVYGIPHIPFVNSVSIDS